MSFNITIQTVYWLILGAVVILFTMWILRLQADVEEIYDQIDANMSQLNEPITDKKKASKD